MTLAAVLFPHFTLCGYNDVKRRSAFDGCEVALFFFLFLELLFLFFASQQNNAQNGLSDRPWINYADFGGNVSFFDCSWILDVLLATGARF